MADTARDHEDDMPESLRRAHAARDREHSYARRWRARVDLVEIAAQAARDPEKTYRQFLRDEINAAQRVLAALVDPALGPDRLVRLGDTDLDEFAGIGLRERLRDGLADLAVHDPLTCEICHAEGTSAEIAEITADRDRWERVARDLAEAVNTYLYAQNTYGYKDGTVDYGADESRAARRRLCEVVYEINASSGASSPEGEQRLR